MGNWYVSCWGRVGTWGQGLPGEGVGLVDGVQCGAAARGDVTPAAAAAAAAACRFTPEHTHVQPLAVRACVLAAVTVTASQSDVHSKGCLADCFCLLGTLRCSC